MPKKRVAFPAGTPPRNPLRKPTMLSQIPYSRLDRGYPSPDSTPLSAFGASIFAPSVFATLDPRAPTHAWCPSAAWAGYGPASCSEFDAVMAPKAAVACEITRNDGYWIVQGHPRPPVLVPIESPYATSILVNNTNLCSILHCFRVIVHIGQIIAFDRGVPLFNSDSLL